MGSEMCIRDSSNDNFLLGQKFYDHVLVTQDALGRDQRFGDIFEQTKRDITCLLYTSDAADERSSVDLGGRRIIKKKNPPHPPPPHTWHTDRRTYYSNQV